MLAVTGDPPEEGDYAGAHGVYDVDAIGLTQIVERMNRGEDYHGRTIDAPTSFFVGVAVNPTADDLDVELERFEAQARSRRAVRDDADHVRPRLRRPLLREVRRAVADPAPSSASGRCGPTSSPSACTTRCPASSSPTTCRTRFYAPARTPPEVGAELDAADRGRAEEQAGIYVVAPFRRPLGVIDFLAG